MRVGKIAIESEDGVLDLAVERVVQRLDHTRAGRYRAERRIELRQIVGLDEEVEFAGSELPGLHEDGGDRLFA